MTIWVINPLQTYLNDAADADGVGNHVERERGRPALCCCLVTNWRHLHAATPRDAVAAGKAADIAPLTKNSEMSTHATPMSRMKQTISGMETSKLPSALLREDSEITKPQPPAAGYCTRVPKPILT